VKTRPFIPRKAPRSFVLAALGGLCGLGAGGIAFLGFYVGSALLFEGGRVLFILCALVVLPMMVAFLVKTFSGRYENIVERSWNEQIW
jgi:ABC-type spermidine/putrescine transport system permease subunit I